MTKHKMNTCVICLEPIFWFKRTELECGHRFHKVCIRKCSQFKNNCPLCNKEILSDDIKELVKCTNVDKIKHLFCKTNYSDVEELILKAHEYNNKKLVNFLMPYADIRTLFNKYIITDDAEKIEKIIKSLNFHQVINGKTILDDALANKAINSYKLLLKYSTPINIPKRVAPPPPFHPLPLVPTAPLYPSLIGL